MPASVGQPNSTTTTPAAAATVELFAFTKRWFVAEQPNSVVYYFICVILVSFAFFRTLQFVVRWYLFGKCTYRTFSYFGIRANSSRSRNSDSRDLSAVPPNKKWRISNEVVSLLHSVVSGLWAAYSLLFYKQLMTDLVNFRCEPAINLIFLSTGYLLHDLLDLLVNEQSARIMELLFHHAVVLTAFAVTMLTNKFLGVVIFGLLMELNSMFLHSRSLLNLYGVDKKAPSFRIVALFNMVTLFFFRLCVSAYLLYFAATSATSLPWYQAVINSVVILSLATTNSVLTYRLLAADGLLGMCGVTTDSERHHRRRRQHSQAQRLSQGSMATSASATTLNCDVDASSASQKSRPPTETFRRESGRDLVQFCTQNARLHQQFIRYQPISTARLLHSSSSSELTGCSSKKRVRKSPANTHTTVVDVEAPAIDEEADNEDEDEQDVPHTVAVQTGNGDLLVEDGTQT